jgi:hypothetical protein
MPSTSLLGFNLPRDPDQSWLVRLLQRLFEIDL